MIAEAPAVDRARARAREAWRGTSRAPSPDAVSTYVAVGDPQTSTQRFLSVLAHQGLLAENGWLRGDVHLVALGDYFDFGGKAPREEVAQDGCQTLSWLAAHDPEQVTLIVGNHDLARVGELVNVSDERFLEAHGQARQLYGSPRATQEAEQEFVRRYPEFPSVEAAARDFSGFCAAQRDIIVELLRSRRLRLAASFFGILLCHAGVTRADLSLVGLSEAEQQDAERVAAALNDTLDATLETWSGTEPLSLSGLHEPGSGVAGEGGGILFHRPAYPDEWLDYFTGPRRRRFDPRALPGGLTQVVGHVRDNKCRTILGPWVADVAPAREGALRQLRTDGSAVAYRARIAEAAADDAVLIFADGGMNYATPAHVELCDLAARMPYQRRA